MRIPSILPLLLLAAAIPAQARPLFGPQQFVRGHGKPETLTATFPRRMIAADYTMTVQNGADGRSRVSSGSVTLNGEEIVRESDLNQNVALLTRTVALRDSNRLDIQLAGEPGGALTITVSVIAGPNGATVGTPAGVQFTIPPGALTGDASVDVADVPLAELGAPVPAGATGIAAVRIDLDGAPMTAPGKLAVPAPPSLPGAPVVARVVSEVAQLAVVDVAPLGADGMLRTASPPFVSIVPPGTFVALALPPGTGIAPVQVQDATGAPRAGALVKLGSISANIAALDGFVGQSGPDGFAPVGGAPPNSTFIAVGADGEVTGLSEITVGGILANGLLTAIVRDLILDQTYQIQNLSPPSPCDCDSLAVDPPRIEPVVPNQLYPRGGKQLRVLCIPSGTDVAKSLPTHLANQFLAGGMKVVRTTYDGYDPNIVTVSDGLVTGVSVGDTRIGVRSVTARLTKVGGKTVGEICGPAVGKVDPVRVTCPPDAPLWNPTARQCQAVFSVSVQGPGSVTTTPAGIANCRAGCTAGFAPGTPITLTATPDANANFAGWSGACSGTNPVVQVTVQDGTGCLATFRSGTIQFVDAACAVRVKFWPPRDLVIVRVYGTINASPDARFNVSMSLLPGTGTWWDRIPATIFYDREVRTLTTFGSPVPNPGSNEGHLGNYALAGPSMYTIRVTASLNGKLQDERTITCAPGFEP